jgi:uncharacterized membrane protein YoaK (UPF0700 family)
MSQPQPSPRTDLASALLLCVASGIVDAVGYVHSGVFAANMTGNTVLTGISLAQGEWTHALTRAATLAWFFLGAMLGRMLWRTGGRQPTLPLVVEAAILAVCAFVESRDALAIWFIATAMGIQATAITKFAGTAVSTIVVTSTMARLAEAKYELLRRLFSREAAGERAPVLLLGGTWLAYAIGAIVAVLSMSVSSVPILLSSVLVVIVLAIRSGFLARRVEEGV